MLKQPRILCSQAMRRFALAGLAVALVACGQKGPLFIPQGPAAAQRATLPETLRPGASPAPMPATAASAAR